MKKARHVDYYPDEYIAGVSVLPYEQQGVYWMICSLVISHGGPIERDEKWFGGLGKMGTAKVRNIVDDLIRKGKLTENDGKISQKRAENAVETAEKRIEIAQENGKKGGRPPIKTNGLDKPGGFPGDKPNHQPPTTNPKESLPNGRGRATRLPAAWTLPDDYREWAIKEGWPADRVTLEADKFHDYWIAASGQKATKRDWLATWRNWMRNVPKGQTNGISSEAEPVGSEERVARALEILEHRGQ